MVCLWSFQRYNNLVFWTFRLKLSCEEIICSRIHVNNVSAAIILVSYLNFIKSQNEWTSCIFNCRLIAKKLPNFWHFRSTLSHQTSKLWLKMKSWKRFQKLVPIFWSIFLKMSLSFLKLRLLRTKQLWPESEPRLWTGLCKFKIY